MGNATVVSIPLMHRQGDLYWGVAVVIGVSWPAKLQLIHEFADDGGEPVHAVLDLWRRHSAGVLARTWRTLWSGSTRKRTAVVAAATALIIGLLCLPMPYRMTCDCEVQPVARRFVVAPFDGVLEESLAAPGDRVQAGQILARLDGREIRLELASTQADYERKRKERDTAMANGQTASAQIARLEMERLDLKVQLLNQREQELEIQSPSDGILIAGDWQRSRGARISVGQTLFEIGPLDQMVVEIAVPEDDIQFARRGAPVRMQMNSAATNWSGSIELLHPRAEIRNDRNVFVAEVTLDNADGALLPGMKGTAKIQGPARALAWNLFHKPWYAVRRWLGA
jgi:biotin carboxyl carrier protein